MELICKIPNNWCNYLFYVKRCIFVNLKTKHKIVLISSSLLLLLGVLVTTISFVGTENPNGQFNLSELNLKDKTTDLNIEKLESPVYYTVFKLILNFLPLKDAN